MKTLIVMLSLTIALVGCIGDDFVDDFVDPIVRINASADSIAVGDMFQFEAMYLNNVGMIEEIDFEWSSSNPSIITIDQDGLATGVMEGSSTLTVTYSDGTSQLTDQTEVIVGENTTVSTEEKSGTVATTSTYTLEGDFTMVADNGNLLLTLADNYKASSALPGLYVYLSNNKNTIVGAYEISKVTTFSGSHTYMIDDVGINDYSHLLYFCKPFNVKVGDGEIQ